MKKPKLKIKESDLQKQILEWLRWNGFFAWKNHTTGVYIKSKDRYMKSPMRGVADIIAIKNGLMVCCEVKARKGVISKEQQKFLDNINEKGGRGFTARCLADVKLNLKDYFV